MSMTGNKTPNYDLPTYASTDYFDPTDSNNQMQIIDDVLTSQGSAVSNAATQAAEAVAQVNNAVSAAEAASNLATQANNAASVAANDALNAKNIANGAATTAGTAQTTATQAQTTATQAKESADIAMAMVDGVDNWIHKTMNKPASSPFTSYNCNVDYNKTLGLLSVHGTVSAENPVSYGTPLFDLKANGLPYPINNVPVYSCLAISDGATYKEGGLGITISASGSGASQYLLPMLTNTKDFTFDFTINLSTDNWNNM